MKNYQTFQSVNRFCLAKDGAQKWKQEMMKRSKGKLFPYHESFGKHHNPLSEVEAPLEWIFSRYRSVFDYLDSRRVRNLVEIGCAHGLSTFLLGECAERAIGVDISKPSIQIAESLFPECEFHDCGFEVYLRNFETTQDDVIIESDGPLRSFGDSIMEKHRAKFICISPFPARNMKEFLTWSHKPKGMHLSYRSVVVGEHGFSNNYWKYYFTSRYLKDIKSWCLINRYYPPL